MPKHSHDTTREQDPQTTQSEDDWSKQVLPQLPANLQEQAMKFKAFERSRKISNASDLLRGLLAYVYTAHSFQHLSMWSVLLGIADESANDWRKRLQKASVWLDWLLQEVLAISSFFSPALVRAGVRRILLIDGTHWQEGEHLEIFDLQPGDLVVTDRANGLRTRIAFVLSKLADIIVRISPSKFPMEDEQGTSIVVVDWLKGLQAPAGHIESRPVWITYLHKRIKLRLIAFRLSEQQQEKAERRTKRKAKKNQQKVRPNTLYFSCGFNMSFAVCPR